MPIIHLHLLCFIFGNVWSLLYAKGVQVNRADIELVCSDNILLLCSSKGDGTCVDTSLCMLGGDRQIIESNNDNLKMLRQIICTEPTTNCVFTENGDYICNLGEPQNSTAIFKVADCWKHNIKGPTLTLDVICYLIIFLSVMAMFLSYLCLKKAVYQTFTGKQKTSSHIKCNLTEETEPV